MSLETARSLITELTRRGVSLRAVDGQVGFFPDRLVSDDEKLRIKGAKAQIMHLLYQDAEQRVHDRTSTSDRGTETYSTLGLAARWSKEFGYVSIHDPTTGEWHDLPVKEAPGWALGEARRRKELYRGGNHGAYRLTSREMEELWQEEHPPEVGIVESYPPEEEES